MLAFDVKDMTCGHCAGAITQAVKAVAPGASVQIDLAHHRVAIDAPGAGVQALRDAIAEAGYTPIPVEANGHQNP